MFLSSLFTCMQMQSANCMFYILELRLFRSCTTTFWSRLLDHFLAKFFTFPLEFFFLPSSKTHNLHWRMFRKPRLRLSSFQRRSGKEMFSDICFGSSLLQHNLRPPFFPTLNWKGCIFRPLKAGKGSVGGAIPFFWPGFFFKGCIFTACPVKRTACSKHKFQQQRNLENMLLKATSPKNYFFWYSTTSPIFQQANFSFFSSSPTPFLTKFHWTNTPDEKPKKISPPPLFLPICLKSSSSSPHCASKAREQGSFTVDITEHFSPKKEKGGKRCEFSLWKSPSSWTWRRRWESASSFFFP